VTQNNRNVFSHSSGGWKFEISVCRAMLSLKPPGEDAGFSLPAFGGCQESSVFLGL